LDYVVKFFSHTIVQSESSDGSFTSVSDREALLWFTAAKADDDATVMDILNRRPEILNEADQHLGMTALHWAIDSGCDKVIRLLMSKDVDVNAIDPEGNTPLHFGFTTVITPFYNNVRINVKRSVRQGDTISPKLFNASLDNIMRTLEWDDMGVKIDGRQLHHLRFADDIVLITPSITQAERMLADFDHACGKIGLQLNLTKTMFMKNGYVSDATFSLNGTHISKCSGYVYFAAYCHREDAAKQLIAKGADRTVCNNDGLTAAEVCDEPTLRALLASPSV
uniref:Reverse transcriptase domain-containing protein n=1 Tax=Nippostrongylus brasiliensis TaxID=27835 RepID=A0A0N4YFD6_NIPBR